MKSPLVLSSKLARFLASLSRFIGFFIIVLGFVVLCGWVLDNTFFKSLSPGLVAMNPLTAIAFMLMGLNLILSGKFSRRLTASCAIFVMLIGLARICGYIGHFDIRIDLLLFHDKLQGNQMAPNTAFNFLLAGLGFLLIESGYNAACRIGQYCCCIVSLLAFLACIGYAYGISSLYGVSYYIPMALNTAWTFIILVFGIFCIRPEQGLMSILTNDTLGGNLARRFLPTVVIIVPTLGWLLLQGEHSGYYNSNFRLALFTILNIATFTALVFVTCRFLFKVDTQRRQFEEELEKSRAVAEKANRAKSEFLATMSHELRTPLNSVIGFSEVLQAQSFGPLNEKQKEYVNDVWESGRYLLTLINDILDLSKVEAGKMELELSEVDLKFVLQNCLIMVKERASRHNLKILLNIDERIGLVRVDERKVKQIIYNLLSNAIKFSHENGEIDLDVKLEEHEDILFSVCDNGVGIEEKDQEKIFQEFVRIDNANSRKEAGTGLGLVLTKRFVELHGGKIWFESKGRDQGTCFRFTLPGSMRSCSLPVVGGPAASSSTAGKEGRPVVLLIEDDPKSAKLITGYLRDFDFAFEIVSSGEEGLKKARELKPYFIILDILLPHKNGWDVLIELKMDPLTKNIPILVTTIVEVPDKGMTLGATDYLLKPISKEDLNAALAKIMPFPIEKYGPVRVLAIDDDVTSLKIIEAILNRKGYQVFKATSGSEGIAMALRQKPEIILLDLMMPQMTGFDVILKLRQEDATKNTPIIVITAKTLSVAERSFLKDQTQTILEKARFDRDALLREVNLMLRQDIKKG